MTKVAIYARVSTGEQAERQTIQAQLHDCRAFAAQKGWEVVGEFPDDGVSGTVPFHEREQGAALLAVLEARAADTILINYADRLARDQLEGVMAYNRLQKLAAVELVSGSFDDSPEGKFTLQVLLSVVECVRV